MNPLVVLSLISALFLSPAPADRGLAELTLAGARIAVDYGRPEMQGRNMLSLARNGMVWRLGMNKATSLSTSADLDFAGVKVPRGDYSLFAKKLGDDEWSLLVNSETGLWGTSGYEAGNDIAEIPLRFQRTEEFAEGLTIKLEAETEDRARFVVHWGNTRLATGFRVADSP